MIRFVVVGLKSHSRYLEAEQTFCFFFLMLGREPRFEPTPNRAQSQVRLGYAEVRRSRRID